MVTIIIEVASLVAYIGIGVFAVYQIAKLIKNFFGSSKKKSTEPISKENVIKP